MENLLTLPAESGYALIAAVAPDLANLIDDWHKSLRLAVDAGEIAATTATTYRVGMGKFLGWLVTNGGNVSADTVRQWKADVLQDHKPGSVNTWLAGVRAFYQWAVETGRMLVNPVANVKGAKRTGTTHSHKREPLTDSEVVRLLDLPATTPAEIRDRAIIGLFVFTGARSVELHRADLADLHTNGALVLSVRGKGRSEADEVIVIVGEAERLLADWLAIRGGDPGPLFVSLSNRSNGDRLELRSIREIVKRSYRKAGIVGERKTTHSLRHTCITNLLRNGGSLQQAQSMARHANVATTSIYAHELNRIENAGERMVNYRRV